MTDTAAISTFHTCWLLPDVTIERHQISSSGKPNSSVEEIETLIWKDFLKPLASSRVAGLSAKQKEKLWNKIRGLLCLLSSPGGYSAEHCCRLCVDEREDMLGNVGQ